MNSRSVAAQVIFGVTHEGRSLSQLLPEAFHRLSQQQDKALLQEFCYGTLRWLPQLESLVNERLKKPLKGRYRVVHSLLLVGMFQMLHTRVPAHAAISETVNGCQELNADPMRGLVNAILRGAQRDLTALQQRQYRAPAQQYCHPGWLIKRVQDDYPAQWQHILQANNERAPMWLRVNTQKVDTSHYRQQLEQAGFTVAHEQQQALCLTQPADVTSLPGFDEGYFAVQDGAAQHAAALLDAQPGERVLDACAAPGGKTAHILERSDAVEVLALDVDEQRLQRVTENLQRLQLQAKVVVGDAAQPEQWWDGQPFDRILLDAPCSGTGVIRRHPDIKWLRNAADIGTLAATQQQILDALWLLLKNGGTLLYATCSILKAENSEQISAFLQRHDDAVLDPIAAASGSEPGWQLLPGQQDMDGFYYARLRKET